MGTYITENFSHATKKEHIAKKSIDLLCKSIDWFLYEGNNDT